MIDKNVKIVGIKRLGQSRALTWSHPCYKLFKCYSSLLFTARHLPQTAISHLSYKYINANISIMIDVFKALCDENRVKIVKLLSSKPKCVCEIEKALRLKQNLVSHHLSVLKEAGLVENCRCGKNNYYSLNNKKLDKVAKQLLKLGGTGKWR